MSLNKLAKVSLLTLLFASLLPLQAYAHSQLTSSLPVANSALTYRPAKLFITFNEKVKLSKNSLQLIDAKGKVLYTNKNEGEDSRFELPTPKGVSKGLFALRYSVLSPDGHRVSELLPFALNYPNSKNTTNVTLALTNTKGEKLEMNCKCKEGLSQLTLATPAKKILLTLTNKTLKAPQYLELKYNSSLFASNLLLIAKGEYQIKVEIYKDDFNIESYSGNFKVK